MLDSTPVAETPFENEPGESATPSGADAAQTFDNTSTAETQVDNVKDNSNLIKPSLSDTKKDPPVNEANFEDNVAPEVAIAELEREAEKLGI